MKARGKRALADVICYYKIASAMAFDGVMSFLSFKEVTNTRKRMQNSPTFGGNSSAQWPKVRRS